MDDRREQSFGVTDARGSPDSGATPVGRLLPGSRCCRHSAGCGADRCRFGCSGTDRGTGSCCRAGRRTESRCRVLHQNCRRTRPWSYNATSPECTSRWNNGTGPHHNQGPLVCLKPPRCSEKCQLSKLKTSSLAEVPGPGSRELLTCDVRQPKAFPC